MAVFLGSGELGAGFDATGMQGLNFRIGQYADTASVTHPDMLLRDNLHLYHSDALSRHYRQSREIPGPQRPDWVPMPLGWLDYELEIDGCRYDTEAFKREATEWERCFTPRKGLLKTSFRLAGCKITWKSNIAPGSYAFDFQFGASALDGRSRDVKITLRCHQTLRDGRPLATGGLQEKEEEDYVYRSWSAENSTSTDAVKDPVTVAWTLSCDREAGGRALDDRIELHRESCGANIEAGFRVLCGTSRTDTHTVEYAQSSVEAFRERGIQNELDETQDQWEKYFEGAAEIWVGRPDKELLTLQQQYLMRAGQSWRNGLFSGNIWGQRFMGKTYWDAFFMCDGMLRCGHVEMVREFADWLVRTMKPEGRPHMWMTYWDGTPGTLGDTAAWFVNLNFAAVQIRLYSYSKSEDDLKERAFPYVHRVAQFLFDEVMGKKDDGWSLLGNTAHDIGKGDRPAEKQQGILAFSVWVLGKCAEFAAKLGVENDTVRKCREVVDYYRANPVSLRNPGMWDMRIPYMGDVEQVADLGSWWEYVREKFDNMPTATYQLMPWWAASAATSLSITGSVALEKTKGATELALRCQNDALDYVCGAGYFNERLYEQQTGGFAPFLPASGAWLSSISTMITHGSSCDDTVHVAVGLPKRWRFQRVRWKGFHTPNGARVSGNYRPFSAEYHVSCPRPCKVCARIPGRLEGELVDVTLNGKSVEPIPEKNGQCVTVEVKEGENVLSIKRNTTKEIDVLLVEPFSLGQRFVEMIEDAGLSVRWLRETDAVGEFVDKARAIVMDVSWVAVPGEITSAIRSGVENGVDFVGLCHAAMEHQDRLMSELVGVHARCTEPWQFTETMRTYSVTETGRALFPELPHELNVPATQVYTADPEPEVEVLAVESDSDQPVMTRRPLGKGRVWWLAPGNKSSNRWGKGNLTRRVILYGDSAEHYAERSWLDSEDFKRMFTSVIWSAATDK